MRTVAASLFCTLLVTMTAAAAAGSGTAAPAATLTVTVADAIPDRGEIRAVIFDSAASMDKGEKPVAALKVKTFGELSTFAFALPAGTYAVRVFQDIDEDGKLGSNLLGIPSEPFGFSNDAIGTMGPPSFDQAAVAHGEQPQAITIRLKR